MTEKNREIVFYEYIAEAMRYACTETGKKLDFSAYIIILPKNTSFPRLRILGMPVYIVESMDGDFELACPFDCTVYDEKALAKIREYKELYRLEVD